MLKAKLPFVTLILCLLVISGCVSKKEKEVQPVIPNETNNLPSFVKDSDFDKVNWDKMVAKIGTNGTNDILGNKNTVGFVSGLGPELKAKQVDKWLWHFWGTANEKLTIVGYHNETSTIHPVLKSGWSIDSIGVSVEKTNGADTNMPSNVSFPESGKWAILVYLNEKLFDTLVITVK